MTDDDRKLVEKCWKFAMHGAFQIEELARQCAQDGISDVNTSLTQDYLKIWNAVRDDIIWHDVYFYGEEALYYYSGSLRETGTDTYREILDALTRNKRRSFLTGFGIFWGLFMLLFLIGGGHGLKQQIGRAHV